MSHPGPRHLGHISYGIFCIHLPVLHLVMRITGYDLFDGHLPQIFTLTLVISLLAAEVLYRTVELPFMRLKDRGPGSAPRASARREGDEHQVVGPGPRTGPPVRVAPGPEEVGEGSDADQPTDEPHPGLSQPATDRGAEGDTAQGTDHTGPTRQEPPATTPPTRRIAGRTARGPRAGMWRDLPSVVPAPGTVRRGPGRAGLRSPPPTGRHGPDRTEPPPSRPYRLSATPAATRRRRWRGVQSLPAWRATRRWRSAAAPGPRRAWRARPAGAPGSTLPRWRARVVPTAVAPPITSVSGVDTELPSARTEFSPASSETRSSAVQGLASTVRMSYSSTALATRAVSVVRPSTSTGGRSRTARSAPTGRA